jgi:hypothetical protein
MREFKQSKVSASREILQTKAPIAAAKEKRSNVAIKRDFFPGINLFFDGAILVAKRSAELLSALEPVVLRLFLLLHLIIDLIIVFVVLLWKAG